VHPDSALLRKIFARRDPCTALFVIEWISLVCNLWQKATTYFLGRKFTKLRTILGCPWYPKRDRWASIRDPKPHPWASFVLVNEQDLQLATSPLRTARKILLAYLSKTSRHPRSCRRVRLLPSALFRPEKFRWLTFTALQKQGAGDPGAQGSGLVALANSDLVRHPGGAEYNCGAR
jgi:hypothetical protein